MDADGGSVGSHILMYWTLKMRSLLPQEAKNPHATNTWRGTEGADEQEDCRKVRKAPAGRLCEVLAVVDVKYIMLGIEMIYIFRGLGRLAHTSQT